MGQNAEEVGHHFKFSTNWQGGKRLCGECRHTYTEGEHIPVDNGLKPRTNYVCPSGGGYGHSGLHTGSFDVPELRRPDDNKCICGLVFVEEDSETWRLTFETQTPFDPEWHPVSVVRSKHAAHAQHEGLMALIGQGEPIRNVELVELRVTPATSGGDPR